MGMLVVAGLLGLMHPPTNQLRIQLRNQLRNPYLRNQLPSQWVTIPAVQRRPTMRPLPTMMLVVAVLLGLMHPPTNQLRIQLRNQLPSQWVTVPADANDGGFADNSIAAMAKLE